MSAAIVQDLGSGCPPPPFSVVIPVFNCERTVAATIASVLVQTEAGFELILVDDGSTDGSLALLHHAAGQDRRVRVIASPNRGVSAARNLGAAHATGRLIAFLDADDLWEPAKLACHLRFHEMHPHLAVSFAGVAFIANDATGLEGAATRSKTPGGVQGVADLLAENPVCTASNIVVVRESFAATQGFREEMRFAEDQEWLVRAASLQQTILGLDEVLVGYRASPDGLSTQLASMLSGWRSFAVRFESSGNLRRAEAVYCRHLARRALRGAHGPFEALGFAVRGLRLHAGGFLGDPRRGVLTLAGSALRPVLTRNLRNKLFA